MISGFGCMSLETETTFKKIDEFEKYWKEKCKEYESMEITPSEAKRLRAGFGFQLRPLNWGIPKSINNWDLQTKLAQIQTDVYDTISKGETNYHNGETSRFTQKYGYIGPALLAIKAIFEAITAFLYSMKNQ
jgi:hypothetical protein